MSPTRLHPGTDSVPCIYPYLPENNMSQVRLFADNTLVYLTTEDANDSLTLQNDLDKLSMWESHWDMEFNPSKCQVVLVTGSKKPIKSEYKLHGQVLETVPVPSIYGLTYPVTCSGAPT